MTLTRITRAIITMAKEVSRAIQMVKNYLTENLLARKKVKITNREARGDLRMTMSVGLTPVVVEKATFPTQLCTRTSSKSTQEGHQKAPTMRSYTLEEEGEDPGKKSQRITVVK